MLDRDRITALARKALPLMEEADAVETRRLLEQLGVEVTTETPETLTEFTKRATAAFEADMQPVVGAIVSALQDSDLTALHGMRGMLPTLLADVNKAPRLADLLSYSLGKAFLDGLQEGTPE